MFYVSIRCGMCLFLQHLPHNNPTELYESAAAALRKSSRDFPNGLSALLKRYLAIGGSLEESRARRCAALVHQTEGAAGRALALLRVRRDSDWEPLGLVH